MASQKRLGKSQTGEIFMTLLEQIGIYLHGRFWVSELADSLKVSRRSVQRWHQGVYPVPSSVYSELHSLVARKREYDAALYSEIMMRLKDRV